MKFTVTFRIEEVGNTLPEQNAFEQGVCTLFERSLGLESEDNFQVSATLALVHYHFPDDEKLREARSWGADALGCGLITMFSAVAE